MILPPSVCNQIPAELRALPNWVVWRRGKIPFNARTDRPADTTDPLTWSTFEDACDALGRNVAYLGVGFVFAAGGGIFGFDADKQRDPDTGEITSEARAWLDRFATYTEVSPSRTGIHAIGYGELPGEGKKRAPFEVYDSGRFFTVTGERLEGYPAALGHVNGPLAELWELLARGGGEIPDALPQATTGESRLTDAEVLEKASNASNGAVFRALWAGDTSTFGNDDSAADMSLCDRLAFYCGCDATQMDRVFRSSGLMRAKWDERRGRSTYGQKTIAEAIRITTSVYRGSTTALIVTSNGRRLNTETGEILGNSGEIDTGDTRPVVIISDKWLNVLIDELVGVLETANSPEPIVFTRNRSLVRMAYSSGQPMIETLSLPALRTQLSASAQIYRHEKRGKGWALVRTDPPDKAVQGLMTLPAWPFPPLIGITAVPIFRTDGSMLARPGYDHATSLIYIPVAGLTIPEVSARPSAEEIARAKDLVLGELLFDFPFVGDADKAHAVALFLLPFCRAAIDGPTPLHLTEAPGAGSGKGLAVEMLLAPALDGRIGTVTDTRDADEQRKRITTQLIYETPAILLDNVTRVLDSDVLASALTARTWQDRVLGANELTSFPVRCIWTATANNPMLSTEIARRCVRIRLNPKSDRPWEREKFRHDIRDWTREHRGDLIWAGLTMIQAWVAAAMPKATKRLGSYEQWSAVIGGVLQVCAIPGFLGNLHEIYEQADAEGTAWRSLIESWWEMHQDKETAVGELFKLANILDALDFGAGSERSQRTRFGMMMARMRDRVINGYTIVSKGVHNKAPQWQLVPTGDPPEPPPIDAIDDHGSAEEAEDDESF